MMRIRLLGSAAAEGWPAMFCECDLCKKARINGFKDIRRRTAYLLDDDTVIDMGPDFFSQTIDFSIDSSKIQRIFVTHSHVDHLTPIELEWRRGGFSVVKHPIDIFGNSSVNYVIRHYPNFHGAIFDDLKLTLHEVNPGDIVETADLKVTAILANHAQEPEKPLNFIIQRGGVTALFGNDSGWWSDESWEILSQYKLDIAILECTMGIAGADCTHKHLGANGTVKVRDELVRRGALKQDAIVIANHFSHNGGNLHQDLEAFFNPKGILVGYDGMIIER